VPERRKKEEGRRKKEEGRRKKEEGRRKKEEECVGVGPHASDTGRQRPPL
jgi:hypothetical protein